MASQVQRDRFRPIEGIRAIRAILRDPEQTEQVFKMLSALGGRAVERNFARFRSTSTGREILEDRRELVERLKDRERLLSAGDGSLGCTYVHFTETQEITADGLIHASRERFADIADPDLDLFLRRIRDMHDLWHTVTKYRRDALGEACLLLFTYGQTRNPALLALVVAGWRRLRKGYGRGTTRALFQAYYGREESSLAPRAGLGNPA